MGAGTGQDQFAARHTGWRDPGTLERSERATRGRLLETPECLGCGWVDRYGNAQLNVDPDELAEFDEHVRLVFDDGSRTARRVSTFASVDRNEVGLVVDAYGLLAIVLDRRSAADELGLIAGSAVTIEAIDEDRMPGTVTAVNLGPRRT